MKPEAKSETLLSITRSKAKMYEYGVPEEDHIRIPIAPNRLFPLAIGQLGDFAASFISTDEGSDQRPEFEGDIRFSAYFFDSYFQSRLNEDSSSYNLLLSSASYYLCGLPGSSSVQIKRLGGECPDLEAEGLENLLAWLLNGEFEEGLELTGRVFSEFVNGISAAWRGFVKTGNGSQQIFDLAKELRRFAYTNGTPRQLLFTDVICTLIQKRHENSSWSSLPSYSDIQKGDWLETLQKPTFIRELWPAQHLLGENGVFRGASAVVQMPTSAGKTKATEFIIRSSFLSGRASLAIIVAPFRALCHEIRNSFATAFEGEAVQVDELSDVLQEDFDIANLIDGQRVLIVTPEKLVYVLRHAPELASEIGLLIYDEGHQFDTGTRGVTYELLMTALRAALPENVQTVLISAVISNAEAVNQWLNGEDSVVVEGTNLSPTYRTIAFASWPDRRGRLQFVSPSNPDVSEFFVPRVIESHELQLKPRERAARIFPSRDDGKSVALYLGLKLTGNGGIAIFCGTKATVVGFCKKVVDVYSRGLPIISPTENSDQDEIRRLQFLYASNLGDQSAVVQSAGLGVLSHHGNTPHGVRLAVEHAMKEGLAKFVICTSTLAQGVNLPIRYLIVTSVYQGGERIKVRDFHNLIGRAGRSGMHTEGSILFADPKVYDKRNARRERWRWNVVKELLNPANAEPCASTILSIFDPLESDDKKYQIKMEPLEFANSYVEGPLVLDAYADEIVARHSDRGFTIDGLARQISYRVAIIASIESYLMAHIDDSEGGMQEEVVVQLAEGTLAHSLAEEDTQRHIVELFKLLADNIQTSGLDAERRKLFGRTLFGVRSSLAIEAWIIENIEEILACEFEEDLLTVIWPLLEEHTRNPIFRKCKPSEVLNDIAAAWVQGHPFYEMLEILKNAGARIGGGDRPRHPTIEHVVEICENALAYDGMLVLGAVTEIVDNTTAESEVVVKKLQNLQKRLKYGLASTSAVTFYELGFADRVVSTDMSQISPEASMRREGIDAIRRSEELAREKINRYPSYFEMILNGLLA